MVPWALTVITTLQFCLSIDMEHSKEKGGKVVSNLVDKAASSGVLPNLGPFKNVFELTNGGIICGNSVEDRLNYGAMPETQDYTAYLNNMSGLNYGMLAMAQAMNGSMQNGVNSLRSENESLKSHYSIFCASYSSIFGDLDKAKGLEANLSKKISALEQEKSTLKRDFDWVIKKPF
nr:hypothetical protein [Tanacetum cinerariifolium]